MLAFHTSAARTPGTLLAAICSPLPEPPMTTPRLPGSATVALAHLEAERRVVVLRVVLERAAVDRLVAGLGERPLQVLLELQAGVVGADEDAHGGESVRLRPWRCSGSTAGAGRWVGALLSGRSVTLLALADVAAVLAVPDVEVIAIDMPIGLSDDGARALRRRGPRLLGRRGQLGVPGAGAAGAGRGRLRRGLRRIPVAAIRRGRCRPQAWQLVPAIRALDDALGDPPLDRVVEVHPELAFRALDERVRDRKGTARGTRAAAAGAASR